MAKSKKSRKKEEEELPRFDPNWSVDNPVNKRAAGARGWRFNLSSGYYKDSAGCLMADRFRQSLG